MRKITITYKGEKRIGYHKEELNEVEMDKSLLEELEGECEYTTYMNGCRVVKKKNGDITTIIRYFYNI